MPLTSVPSDPAARVMDDALRDAALPGVPVWHYDGITALRRNARLVADAVGFVLEEAGVAGERLEFSALTPRDGDGAVASYGLKGRPGWRIGFDGPVPVDLARRLPRPQRYGRLVDHIGLWRAALVFAVVAVIAMIVVLRTPALVARLVPPSVERQLGEVMIGDFGRKGCTDPHGSEALAKLARRIDPDDPLLEVHVVKLPMVNAVTLPGGRIVIFDGLLQAAQSPDEVAGVIGHEVGHVRNRDVMESLLRQMGLSVLLGGLEGHVGGYTNAVLATAYSRDAESRADGQAIGLLSDAKLSPMPTARFFLRLSKGADRTERMFAYVASHPVSSDRAARFRRSVRPGAAYTPALDPAEWRALQGICKGETDGIDWRF